jgi:hypothetical protein
MLNAHPTGELTEPTPDSASSLAIAKVSSLRRRETVARHGGYQFYACLPRR